MNLDDRISRAAAEAAQLFDDAEVPEFRPPRRRGPLVATGVAVMVGTAIFVAAVWPKPRSDYNTIPSATSMTTSTSTSTSTTPSTSMATSTSTVTSGGSLIQPVLMSLEIERPVRLRVFTIYATDRNVGEVAVADLDAGTSTVYPAGASDISGLVTGAVMTPQRDLVVWTYDPAAYVFSDDLTIADLELHPEPGPDAGFAAALSVVPTPDGKALWVVQPGAAYGDIDVATLVELIELPTGRRLVSFQVDPNAFPVGATNAGLVLNTERLLDTGDGWITELGSEQVIIADTDGSLTDVGPGRALAAAAETIVRRVCTSDDPFDCELLIGDVAGAVTRPGDGTWAPVGGPQIPSETMPLQPISPDGTSLLVAFGEDPDANGTPAHSILYVVGIRDGSARDIATFEGGYPLATWSADGRWIAVISGRDITMYSANDPTSFFTVEDAIPQNHFPFAAG